MDQVLKDRTTKLHEAIGKLEAYSLQQLELSQNPSVFKTMSIMRSILAKYFDPHQEKHRYQQILSAIEEINRNRLLIQKFQEGTPAEQELAEKITHTVNNYNASFDQRIQFCVTGKQRLANFFSKDKQTDQPLPRIALLEKSSIPFKPFHKKNSKESSDIPLSKQSTELFHMKAITLLESHGIGNEARHVVKQSPIHTNVLENICTLTQTLSIFPGQTIVVMGESALDPKTMSICTLLPQSFKISLESPTGFPHPIQRAGWTLASKLIPDSPQRIDLLGEIAPLFQRRNKVITGLLEQGALMSHAKEILSLKKKIFKIHAKEFLDLNETLMITILESADAQKTAFEAVRTYFQMLNTHPLPLETLADASQTIREISMVNPHKLLLEAIIKGKSTDLGNNSAVIRFKIAKRSLDYYVEQSVKETFRQIEEANYSSEDYIKWNYIAQMGSIFGQASKAIFLQHLSEDLIFQPPKLTLFESKIQKAAYVQLADFLNELSNPLQNDFETDFKMHYQLLKKQIHADILLFKEQAPPKISIDLADYFEKRYQSLNSFSE